MRIITWNTAGRVRNLADQVTFLAAQQPDFVALQEVTRSTVEGLTRGLAAIGLTHVSDTVHLTGEGPRRYGVLTASRSPHSQPKQLIDSPWPEKALSTRLKHPSKPFELHNVHVPPGSSNGWVKIEVLEAIYQALAEDLRVPRILCGDFNLPKEERPDGTVVTWGQRVGKTGKIRLIPRRGPRWHLREWNIAVGLRAFNLWDVYRRLHGYDQSGYSWAAKNRGREFPRRFDHIYSDLSATGAEYLLEAREARLSDHAPLLVEFSDGHSERRRPNPVAFPMNLENIEALAAELPKSPPQTLDDLPSQLRLYEDDQLEIWYAPVGYVNRKAKLAIFGITPGWRQMQIAYGTAITAIAEGTSPIRAHRKRKPGVAFAGSMRRNLTSMLDELGLPELLDVGESAELFGSQTLHTGSVLKYPVFRHQRNYSGHSPRLDKHPALQQILGQVLAKDLLELPKNCVWLPLGSAAEQGLRFAAREAGLERPLILGGFPHPSGANGHRQRQFHKNKRGMRRCLREWLG